MKGVPVGTFWFAKDMAGGVGRGGEGKPCARILVFLDVETLWLAGVAGIRAREVFGESAGLFLEKGVVCGRRHVQ